MGRHLCPGLDRQSRFYRSWIHLDVTQNAVFLHFSCVLTTWLIALFHGSISVRWGEDEVLLPALTGHV